MNFNRYNVPRSIENKDEIIDLIRRVFEAADDVLLDDVDWCKAVISKERSIMCDLEELLVGLLEEHYDRKVSDDSVE